MTKCLKSYFATCKQIGLDGFSLSARRTGDTYEVIRKATGERLGETAACCGWQAKEKMLPGSVVETATAPATALPAVDLPEGCTDLGHFDPKELGKGARAVYKALKARLFAQGGELYLGVMDRDPVSIGKTTAPDDDYGSVSPKFLAKLSGACGRQKLNDPPKTLRVKGARRQPARYADAVGLRLAHKDDTLHIAAGRTVMTVDAERAPVYAVDQNGWARDDDRPFQELMAEAR